MFSKLRKAEIFFLAACRFRRILRNTLHHCIFGHSFPNIFQSSLLYYFSPFWVPCPSVLFSSVFGQVNSDLVCRCLHVESCSMFFPSFFFVGGVWRVSISPLTLINSSTHIQCSAETLSPYDYNPYS